MKQNLLVIYWLILVAGCAERHLPSVPMQSSALSFLDLSVQGPKGAYAQDPYAESVRSADGKTTNLFSICNTNDTGRRPLALDCASGHSEAQQRRANQLILHNTLESLIDTVHVFRGSKAINACFDSMQRAFFG